MFYLDYYSSFCTIIVLFIAAKAVVFLVEIYVKYKLAVLHDIAIVFKFICVSHVESARSASIFSIDERNSMLYSINKNVNYYKTSVNPKNITKYNLSIENSIDSFVSMLKLCDDLNYVTVQTTAHELEYMAWFLIVEKIKLYRILSTLRASRVLAL